MLLVSRVGAQFAACCGNQPPTPLLHGSMDARCLAEHKNAVASSVKVWGFFGDVEEGQSYFWRKRYGKSSEISAVISRSKLPA